MTPPPKRGKRLGARGPPLNSKRMGYRASRTRPQARNTILYQDENTAGKHKTLQTPVFARPPQHPLFTLKKKNSRNRPIAQPIGSTQALSNPLSISGCWKRDKRMHLSALIIHARDITNSSTKHLVCNSHGMARSGYGKRQPIDDDKHERKFSRRKSRLLGHH